MGRASVQFVIILVCLNSAAGMLTLSGVAAALDIQPEVGGDKAIEQADEAASSIEPGSGLGETLFALYTSVSETFWAIISVLFYGPLMLMNLGIPSYIIWPVFGPATVVSGIDLIYALSGRDL